MTSEDSYGGNTLYTVIDFDRSVLLDTSGFNFKR